MPRVDRGTPVYPIGIVERLTGLTGRQIRYYEEAGLIRPARSRGNRRLYSPEDVDRLLVIKQWLARGMNLEGVKALFEAGVFSDPLAPEGASLPAEPSRSPDRPAGRQRKAARRRNAVEDEERPTPATGEAPDPEADERIVYFLNQAKGRPTLASLYPVTRQAELIRRLQKERGETE